MGRGNLSDAEWGPIRPLLPSERGRWAPPAGESLPMRSILPFIPPRSNRKVSAHPGYRQYQNLNRTESPFGKLKHATRYVKIVVSFESLPNLCSRSPMATILCQRRRAPPKRPTNGRLIRSSINACDRYHVMTRFKPVRRR